MRTTIKSVLTAIVVVCMVATGLSLSAAAILDNGKKEVKSEKVFASQWYNLSATGSTEASQIIGTEISSKPNTPGCRDVNSGNRCAVQINFSGDIPDFDDVKDKSVAFILTNYPGSSVADATRVP